MGITASSNAKPDNKSMDLRNKPKQSVQPNKRKSVDRMERSKYPVANTKRTREMTTTKNSMKSVETSQHSTRKSGANLSDKPDKTESKHVTGKTETKEGMKGTIDSKTNSSKKSDRQPKTGMLHQTKINKRNQKSVDYTGQNTALVSNGKLITMKGAQLGKYTDIYLRPCEEGNLEIKEYLPLKITGIIVMEENKLIVIEEMKKLVTYTASEDGQYGKFGSWIEFKLPPRGICRLEQVLYIAFSDRTVKQVALEDKLNVENSFFMEYICSGITTYKGNLAVGLENGKIIIVDTKGDCLNKVIIHQSYQRQYIPRSLLETPDGNILFCDTGANAVVNIKDNGSIIFIYTGMINPYCAVCDPYKNVIVVGQNSDSEETIQLLTEKGNKVKVLKYRKELGIQPYCIVNVKDKMKLAISGDSNKIQFYHIEKCRPRTKRELEMQQHLGLSQKNTDLEHNEKL